MVNANLLVMGALGIALMSAAYTNLSAEELEPANKTDASTKPSTMPSPLSNAKITTLNFTQSVKLGLPLGVLIRPDSPNPISDKLEPNRVDESPTEKSKR